MAEAHGGAGARERGPEAGLDVAIHPLPRLRICAHLLASGAVQGAAHLRFAALRDALGVTDSALSKQLSALSAVGYVDRSREFGRTRDQDVVWVALTERGRAAYRRHLAALQAMAAEEPEDGGR